MVSKYQLKNGLKVLLVESHKSPVVSVQMWVRTGSADEKRGIEGISHFIEHLVFKGTRRFGVGEIAQTVEGAGGELNAYTSFDQTVFYVTISKEFCSTGLEVISEMMGFPTFDPKEIDNEREVVIEEIKRGQDSPQRQAAQALFSTVYQNHPYRVPVIGYDKNIREVTPQTIRKHFSGRYNPKNMFLLISGDISQKDIKKDIEKMFSDIPKHKISVTKRKRELLQKKPRIEIQTGDFKDNIIHMAWPIPGFKNKDIPALDLAASILGQGESSRLSQALRIQEALTLSVGASTFTPLDPGFFVISSSLQKEKIADALSTLQKTMVEFLSAPPAQEELDRAIMQMQGDDVFSRETVDGLSRKYGNAEHLFHSPKAVDDYLKKCARVKPKDVLAAARKFLKPETMNLVMLTKDGSSELRGQLELFQKSFGKSFPSKAKPAPVKKNAKGASKIPSRLPKWPQAQSAKKTTPTQFTAPNGTKIIFYPNKELPICFLQTSLMGGLRAETADQGGWTELLSRCWTSGSQNFSEQEIQKRVEGTSGSLTAFGGRNTVGLSLVSLAPFMQKNFEVYKDILSAPQLSDRVLAREKEILLQELKLRQDNPAQLAILEFTKNMFKGHPYAKDLLGEEKTITRANSGGLKSFWNQMLTSRSAIVLAGHVNPEDWKAQLTELTSKWTPTEGSAPTFALDELKQDQHHYLPLQKEQSHVILGYRGLTLTDPRRYTMQVMQSILSGQGGRLFVELRDKKSMAYSVSPLKMEGIDTGYFGAYIGCSPEKAGPAIEGMDAELKRLCDTRVSEDELSKAKRYLIGRHDIGLQRISSIGSALLFDAMYGLPMESVFEFSKYINQVTAADVQTLAQSLFSKPKIITVVGKQNPF